MSTGLKVLVFGALCLIWSSTWMMIKVGLEGAPPLAAAGLRFIIASFVILVIMRARRIALPGGARFWRLSLFLGVFQMAIPYALVYWGEQHISSGLTAILYSTMPITVAILARLILGDPLTLRKLAGILFGAAGVVIIFADSLRPGAGTGAHGVAAILVSATFASLSSVVVKKFSSPYNPFASILPTMFCAGVLLTAVSSLTERHMPAHWNAVTFATVLYLAILGSVVAFALYFWIIKHLDVTVLSYQTFIIPILASLLGWIFLDETIRIDVAIGAALILLGIALIVFGPARARRLLGVRP